MPTSLLLLAQVASATVFTFSGEVTLDPACPEPGLQDVSLSLDFATATPGFGAGNYVMSAGEMTIGSLTVPCGQGNFHVSNDLAGQDSMSFACTNLGLQVQLQGGLRDSTATVFDSTALPTALDRADFDIDNGFVVLIGSSCNVTGGQVLEITEGYPPSLTLAERVDQMVVIANAHHNGTNPALLSQTGPWARRPSTLVLQLQAMLDALAAGGCLGTPEATGHLAGAYSTTFTGEDEDGVLTSTFLHKPSHTFGATFSGGSSSFGAPGQFSAYNSARQIVAVRSDGGFVAGKWVQAQGTTGVWLTLTGTCDNPVDPLDALDPWYSGNLP